MVNTRNKGTRYEKLCLDEFKAYMATKPDYVYVDDWKSIANKFNNTDLYHSFDWAIVYNYKAVQVEFRGQVKSTFSKKYYLELQKKWNNSLAHNYLCVYGKWANTKSVKANQSKEGGTKMFQEIIKLPHFKMVRIC